jgi:[ribosomal protein S5]-alanine N-acetyltransferase
MASKLFSRRTTCTARPARVPDGHALGRWPLKAEGAPGDAPLPPAVERIVTEMRGDDSSTEIVTERLRLRLLTADDAPHFVRLFQNDWDAVKQTGRMPYPVTEPAMRDWIALHAAGASRTYLMARKEDGAALGGVGFGGIGNVHELGYALGRPYWGQGYATEGVLAMIEYARSLGLKALQAFTFVENPASARVLRKAGFTDLGVARRDYPMRGGLRRVRHYLKRL